GGERDHHRRGQVVPPPLARATSAGRRCMACTRWPPEANRPTRPLKCQETAPSPELGAVLLPGRITSTPGSVPMGSAQTRAAGNGGHLRPRGDAHRPPITRSSILHRPCLVFPVYRPLRSTRPHYQERSMCLNKKVLAGLGAVAAVLLLLRPAWVIAALPV